MQSSYWDRTRRLSRRRFVQGLGLVAGGFTLAPLVAACSSSNNTGGKSNAAAPSGATSATAAGTSRPAASVAGTTAAGARQPTGTLRMIDWEGPALTDPVKEDSPDLIMTYGLGECLTRVTPDVKLAPWLAQKTEIIDAQTTHIVLQPGLTFWDGSPLDAQAVKTSLERVWAGNPAADAYISKQSQVTFDSPTSLTIKTPAPQGNVLNNLANYPFIVHKALTEENIILSGPFKATSITKDAAVSMDAYTGHWGGVAKIKHIDAKIVPDANTRALALQSGDADFAWQLPVEQVDQLKSQFTIVDVPSFRVSIALLNVQKPPFDDLAARKAFALGIDRDALVKGVLLGAGIPLHGTFPPGFGTEVVETQTLDVAQAKQLLDQAGWQMGGDGVRSKSGIRLSFTALTYPGRPELKPLSIAIQSQLKPLGFEVKPQEVQSITAATKSGDFGAAFATANTLLTADPQYFYDFAYVTGGGFNLGKYSSAKLDGLVMQLRGEIDPAKRVDLSKQIQTVLGQDVPAVYMVTKTFKAGYVKKFSGYQPQPDDAYLVTTDWAIG